MGRELIGHPLLPAKSSVAGRTNMNSDDSRFYPNWEDISVEGTDSLTYATLEGDEPIDGARGRGLSNGSTHDHPRGDRGGLAMVSDFLPDLRDWRATKPRIPM